MKTISKTWRTLRDRFAAARPLAALAFLLFGAFPASADQSPAGCSGSGLGIDLFGHLQDVHVGDTLRYSVRVFNSPFPACDASGIQAGVVTPDGVTNMITQLLVRNALAPGESDFYPDVVSYVVRAQDIRPDGTVRATAFDNGDIHQNDTNSRGGGNQGINTEVNLPCILVTAVCVGGVGENGAITFSGSVTNCGNNTLVGVTITNFVNNIAVAVLSPVTLAIGQVATFSGSWVPLDACAPSVATLTVRGTDEFTRTPRTVTNFTTITCQNTLTAGIKVTKNCPSQPVAPGTPFTFTGTVQNTGNSTLSNVLVVNDQPAPNTTVFKMATLAPGEVANFFGSYTAPADCSVTDILTASALGACGQIAVTDSATATCAIQTNPSILVTSVCPTNPVLQGELLAYTGSVLNSGKVGLANVIVVSDRPAANTPVFTIAFLAPGASANFSGSYRIPTNCCVVTSELRASGEGCAGEKATDTVTRTCTVQTLPKLSVTKNCPTGPLHTGDRLAYNGRVANTGNITLVNVTVVNDQSPAGQPLLGPVTMAPGESFAYSGSYVVPADFCGTDTVTAKGFDVCTSLPVANSVTTTCPVVTALPRISVTKNCPLLPTPRGGLYTYTGSVGNPGPITLINVFVFDNEPDNNTPVIGPITLAPGAVANFTNSYVAPHCCCFILDTLTARGQDLCTGRTVTSTATTVCPLLSVPEIGLVEDVLATPILMGSLYSFSGYVTNTGVVVLTNVFVFGPQGTNAPVLGPIELAPGESEFYAGSYNVPFNICSLSVTAVGQETCGGQAGAAAIVNPVVTSPQIKVSVLCPTTPVMVGDSLAYAGTVQNMGDITLTNVVVASDRPVPNTVVFTLETLLPGAVANFTGSYPAPADCSATSVLTAAGRSICGVAVTNSATSTCPVQTNPSIRVTADCPLTPLLPGGSVAYNGTVRNTGNVTLNNVVVRSDHPAPNTTVFTVSSLAPGAFADFTAVSVAPPTACSLTTAFAASGKDACSPGPVTSILSTTCTVLTAPAITVSLACPLVPAAPGGPITFSGTVANSGNVTLNNVFVVGNQPVPNTAVIGPLTLAPGAVASFNTTFAAPADACSVATKVNATGKDACTLILVAGAATATCDLATAPALVVTQACPAIPPVPGGLVSYTGTVKNGGNVTLANVVVLNSMSGATPIFSAPSLAPGAIANFSGSYAAPNDCSSTSVSTATARSACGVDVTGSVTSNCPIGSSPSLALTADCPLTPPLPGGSVTYTGTVRNTGNVALKDVVVLSDHPAANTSVFTIATLAPGASANFTAVSTLPTGACSLTTAFTASGKDSCSLSPVTSPLNTTCTVLTAPAITVSLACPLVPAAPGGPITFSGTVANSGNVTLNNVFVVGNQPVPNTAVIGPLTLAPGAVASFNTTFAAPADACTVATKVNATGKDACTLILVAGAATATCDLATAPALVVTQTCPVVPPVPGGLVSFTGTVKNGGNVTLANVVVLNSMSGATPVFTAPSLAPGAIANFSGSYAAPNDCSSTSVSTATARSACGIDVTGSVTSNCPIGSSPSIAVTADCPLTPLLPGGSATYTGTVRNTGNVALKDVVVMSDHPAANTSVFTVASLAPGASANFTAVSTVPPGACSITTAFTASGKDSCSVNVVTSPASATCAIVTAPALSLTETCPPGPVSPGDSVAFGGVVRNTGDITLTNVFVFSSQPKSGPPLLGPLTLAPGASAPFAGSYIAIGGSDGTTNMTIVTNSANTVTTNVVKVVTTNTTVTVTTNAPTPVTFGTIDSVAGTVVDRFPMNGNFNGLTYAGEDHGYGATEFYTMRENSAGNSFFDTIIATTATVTDRFGATDRAFDALTYAAGDLGYGPLLFYYLSHDNAGVSTFGSITPGGAVGVVADHFVVGKDFDALTFTATDVGYGANLFYYVRHDAAGLSTFGTINPALPGTVTDRFTVGSNVDALVFTDLVAPGFGPNNFYYLRHDAAGLSTLGTIFVTGLSTATVTDRLAVGPDATELTFTATDAGAFGANLFYFLRGGGVHLTTNMVTTFATNQVTTLTTNLFTTFTTNSVVLFTPTNTVTASGIDICQARTVAAAADCRGPVALQPAHAIVAQSLVNGSFRLLVPTLAGRLYTVQCADSLNDPVWMDMITITGTGESLSVSDPEAKTHASRFYRILSLP